MPTGIRNDATYQTSRETTLCAQIAAKQPLALALAKTVRVCHFTDWNSGLGDPGSWALFSDKYIVGMLHMKNIRELKFTASYVDAEHWKVITVLGSLEELSFDPCRFRPHVVPRENIRVKVSHLRAINSIELRPLVAAMDARCLRIFTAGDSFVGYVDWLSRSALTELHLSLQRGSILNWYIQRLHAILMQTPQSLEELEICIDVPFGQAEVTVRSTFDNAAWKNLPLLRSFTLCVYLVSTNTPIEVRQLSSSGVSLTRILGSFRRLRGT